MFCKSKDINKLEEKNMNILVESLITKKTKYCSIYAIDLLNFKMRTFNVDGCRPEPFSF